MSAFYLVASIAGRPVAIPADRVEAVTDIRTITPVPRAPACVAGLAALRSRVITVLDPAAEQRGAGAADAAGSCRRAVVMAAGEDRYGVLVDSVEDVVEIADPPRPVDAPLSAAWSDVALGQVDHGRRTLLVIDPLAGAPLTP